MPDWASSLILTLSLACFIWIAWLAIKPAWQKGGGGKKQTFLGWAAAVFFLGVMAWVWKPALLPPMPAHAYYRADLKLKMPDGTFLIWLNNASDQEIRISTIWISPPGAAINPASAAYTQTYRRYQIGSQILPPSGGFLVGLSLPPGKYFIELDTNIGSFKQNLAIIENEKEWRTETSISVRGEIILKPIERRPRPHIVEVKNDNKSQ